MSLYNRVRLNDLSEAEHRAIKLADQLQEAKDLLKAKGAYVTAIRVDGEIISLTLFDGRVFRYPIVSDVKVEGDTHLWRFCGAKA